MNSSKRQGFTLTQNKTFVRQPERKIRQEILLFYRMWGSVVWYIRTAISKEPAVSVIRADELSMYPDAGCGRFLKRITLHGDTSQRTLFGLPWERQTSQEWKRLEMDSDYSRMIEVRVEHVLVQMQLFEIGAREMHCLTVVKPSWRHFLPHRAFTHKELTSHSLQPFRGD